MDDFFERQTNMKILSGTSTLMVSGNHSLLHEVNSSEEYIHYQDNKLVWVKNIDLENKIIEYSFYQKLTDNSLCLQSGECSNAAVASFVYALNQAAVSECHPYMLLNSNNDSQWILMLENKKQSGKNLISISKKLNFNSVIKNCLKYEVIDGIDSLIKFVEILSFNKLYVFNMNKLLKSGLTINQIEKWVLELSIKKIGYKIIGFTLSDNILQTIMGYRGEIHRSFPISSLSLLITFLEFHTEYELTGIHRCINMKNNNEFKFVINGGKEKWIQTTVHTDVLEVN